MKKKYLKIIIALILLNLMVLVFMLSKVTHIGQNQIDASNYTVSNDFDNYRRFDELETLQDLEDESEIILKIKMKGERKIAPKDFIIHAEVLEVFKGDQLKVADRIDLIEPCFYLNGTDAVGGYVPTIQDIEYIVFLKSTKIENTYMFVSAEFGHFKLDNQPADIYKLTNELKTVGELSNYDFIYAYESDHDLIEYIQYDISTKKSKAIQINTKGLIPTFIMLKNEINKKYQ